jgi:hypothetical protein
MTRAFVGIIRSARCYSATLLRSAVIIKKKVKKDKEEKARFASKNIDK